MIVGFDGSRAFTSNRTGTENYSYQLLKNLAKIDHQNLYKIFLRPNSVIPPFSPVILAREQSERVQNPIKKDSGVSTNVLPQNDKKRDNHGWPENFQFIILNFQFLWTQVGLAIQTFVEPIDVLFVPAHTLPLIRAPWVKTVVTVHDLGSEYLPQTHQIKQRLYLSLMQNYQLKTASKLIAVSQATKEDLVKKIGLPENKIEVVYEGYDSSKFKVQSSKSVSDILKKYNLKSQEYFLFVGTVQPRKNLTRLIEAFNRFVYSSVIPVQAGIQKTDKSHGSRVVTRDDKLVIVGKKGWMSDEIYAFPKKLGIEDRVKFLDYVKDEDLPALYAGSMAFVYPSLFEGFGLPILEAQACGSPVITSNVSSMPEVAGKGAILVDPYRVEEITNAMMDLGNKSQMTNNKRKKLINAGFENIKRFSWEKCARETLAVLEKTIDYR